MTQDTNTASGSADLPEALRLADELCEAIAEYPEPTALEAQAAAELLRQHAENETLRAGYAAARLEVESLKAQLHAAKQINAAQFRLLAASIPGSALRASHGQASSQAGEYPALVCDYCGALTPDPWHSSGMLHGKMSKHIHSCDACASHGQAPAQPVDFTTLGAAMRAIQQAIGLIGDPADERMQAVRRVLRGAVVVAEDSGDITAQPSPTAQSAESVPALDRDRIREIFMAYGFTVKEGQTDLKQYVYDAAEALLRAARAQADSVQEDAACWQWLAEYLVGTRTDLDDEIVASETVNDLRKLVDADLAARKQGEKQ